VTVIADAADIDKLGIMSSIPPDNWNDMMEARWLAHRGCECYCDAIHLDRRQFYLLCRLYRI
jgi:hypothetical protein